MELKIPGPREADIVRDIRRLLDRLGCWHIKTLGGLGQRPGVPDILACCGGHFVAVEVKRPGRGPTRTQELELWSIRKAGGIAVVAHSAEDVFRALAEAGVVRGGSEFRRRVVVELNEEDWRVLEALSIASGLSPAVVAAKLLRASMNGGSG